jgi:hypothetical protein
MITAVQTPGFAKEIQYFGELIPGFDLYGKTAVITN